MTSWVDLSTTVACAAGYGAVTDLFTEICEPIDGDRGRIAIPTAGAWQFLSK
jgi:hypothetical protein